MNRALRRKQAKRKDKSVLKNKQVLNPQTTGLSLIQLNQLQQFMQAANAADKEGRDADAERFCRQALALYPNYSSPLAMLARIAYKYDKFEMAVEYMQRSIEILPDVPGRLSDLSNYLKRLDRQEEALEVIERFLELKPDSVHQMNNRAGILNILGRSDEAVDVLEKILKKAPQYGKPYFNVALQTRFKDDHRFDKYFSKLSEDIGSFRYDADLIDGHFALGKYFEDRNDYIQGFQHYIEANRILSKPVDYDVSNDLEYLQKIAKWFPGKGKWLDEKSACLESNGPLFIVGMPRSGTTLTEQILASHPEIHGAGELRYLAIATNVLEAFNSEGELLPTDEKKLKEFREKLKNQAIQVNNGIMALGAGKKHVVDKLPHNFLSLGYKHMMLPNAKIIHCKRNPVDTCLSIFKQQFEGKLYFSTDLRDLGKYYVGYQKLMEHWKNVLPDQILEVQYEDVIDDLEGQARRIVDFIGVEWDDACLEFYKHKRSVQTASTNQVRQPIYNSSVGKFKKYGDLLTPLLEELEPVLSD